MGIEYTNGDFSISLAKIFAIIFIGIVGLWLVFNIWTTVPAGNVGVQDTFGSVSDTILPAGFSFVNPLTNVHPINYKTTELKETAETPSKEGLSVTLDVSLIYHVDPTKVLSIYKGIGTDYEGIIIQPNFRSAIRQITAGYDVQALYSSERDKIALEIENQIVPKLEEKGFVVEQVLLRQVTLPKSVQDSIQAKQVADQQQQTYDFTLKKEAKEAERKVIEAKGIAQSQEIISSSLTTPYLTYLWINSLQNQNNVIYVPITSSGMPEGLQLVKDVDKSNAKSLAQGNMNATSNVTVTKVFNNG